MHLGREIRRRRAALGWSLEELSHRSGISARYLSELERDRRDPSLSTVVAVAKALGAEPGELLGIRSIGGAGLEAGRLFEGLSTDAQTAVLRLMRLLARRRR